MYHKNSLTRIISKILIFCSICLSTSVSLSFAADTETKSCQKFVQEFYNWYMTKCKQENKKLSPLEIALNTKKALFEQNLYRGFKTDLEAQAKVPDEVVGMDFDPILNTQEESTNYFAKKVSKSGQNYLVEIWRSNSEKTAKSPELIAELSNKTGHWQFVNFIYPGPKPDNVLNILQELKTEREKYKKPIR